MSSSSKTTNLELNKWALSDKPKCEDFNADNEKIDSVLGNHRSNSIIHVTAEDKALWNAPFVTGTFAGNNRAEIEINLGFKPKLVIVYPNSAPPMLLNNSVYRFYAGMATASASGYGLTVTSTGFKITHMTSADVYGCMARLNDPQFFFGYVAFK